MVIAHIIAHFQPELGYKEYFLAKHQARLGHEVHVITSDRIYPFPNLQRIMAQLQLPPTRQRPVGVVSQDGFTVHRLPTLMELGTALMVKGLRQEISRVKPELMIIHGPSHVMPAIATRTKPPGARILVEDQQFQYPKTVRGKMFYWLCGWWLCQMSYNRADVINFVTPQTESFAKSHYRLPAVVYSRIPLGFDPDTFRIQPEVRAARRRDLAIADPQCVFLTAGKIQRGKNYELLLHAFAALPPGRDAQLYIVGGGDDRYRQELQQLSVELKIGTRVHWQDLVPPRELPAWYNLADAGIWPDWPSITILEAIGSGLPVIVPNRPTVSHLVAAGNGFLFTPNEPASLTAAMADMCNPDRRRRCRAQTKLVSDTYSYRRLAQQFIDAGRPKKTNS